MGGEIFIRKLASSVGDNNYNFVSHNLKSFIVEV